MWVSAQKVRLYQKNPPWPRPGLDMLLELLIEHKCLIRVRYMATKSHQGRPQSPFAKGGSNRNALIDIL